MTAAIVAAMDLLFIIVALLLSTVDLQIVAAPIITDHPIVGAVQYWHSSFNIAAIISVVVADTTTVAAPQCQRHRDIQECCPSILDEPLLSVQEA